MCMLGKKGLLKQEIKTDSPEENVDTSDFVRFHYLKSVSFILK